MICALAIQSWNLEEQHQVREVNTTSCVYRWRLRKILPDQGRWSTKAAANTWWPGQRLPVLWLGEWRPAVSLRAIRAFARLSGGRSNTGAMQLPAQLSNARLGTRNSGGLHYRPWWAVQIPDTVALDARALQLRKFQPHRVRTQKNHQRVDHDADAIRPQVPVIPLLQPEGARDWRRDRLHSVRPGRSDSVYLDANRGAETKLVDRQLNRESERKMEVREHAFVDWQVQTGDPEANIWLPGLLWRHWWLDWRPLLLNCFSSVTYLEIRVFQTHANQII